MFDQTFVNTHAQTRRPWTVAASLALQTGFIAVVLVLPLLHPEIPHTKLEAPLQVSLKKITRPATPAAKMLERTAAVSPRPEFTRPFLAPTRVPPRVSLMTEAPPADPALTGPPSSPAASAMEGLMERLTPAVPQRAPERAPAVTFGPVRVGGAIQSAKLISAPKPRYPPFGIAAHVQGTVRIQAIIATNGSIRNLQVMSGPSLLVNPAIDAVKQWRYQPTLLNGSPVEVITEVDVVFTLSP